MNQGVRHALAVSSSQVLLTEGTLPLRSSKAPEQLVD